MGLLLASGPVAHAAEVRIIAPNAVKEAVMAIAERFRRESGHAPALAWAGSEAIAKRVTDGETFDVIVTTDASLDRLAAAGKLVAAAKADFSRSAVAAAVRAGLARPDISSTDGVRRALMEAGTIAISSGASGRYLEQLFERLGVTGAIRHKIRQPPSGAQIGEMLVRGEADLGFQQVSELHHVEGITYLGPLPAELQGYTVWSAAPHVAAREPDAARALLQALTAPASAAAIRAAGLEPWPPKGQTLGR